MAIFYHTIHSLWMVFWFPTDLSVGRRWVNEVNPDGVEEYPVILQRITIFPVLQGG